MRGSLGYNVLYTRLRYVTSSHPIRSCVLVVYARLVSVENGEGSFTVHNGSVLMVKQ